MRFCFCRWRADAGRCGWRCRTRIYIFMVDVIVPKQQGVVHRCHNNKGSRIVVRLREGIGEQRTSIAIIAHREII